MRPIHIASESPTHFNYEYVGSLHIHSVHSDGGRSTPEIAGAAIKAGLDFICLNDHDFMTDALHLEEEGFYDSLLVLKGSEIGKRYHHYLAYNLKNLIQSDGLKPQEVIDRVNEQGGFGYMAHPFEKGMPFVERSVAYTWNDLSVEGYTGICIWNYMSRWKEQVRNVLLGLKCLAFKTRTLQGPSKKTLAFWDEQCLDRRVVAVGGSDAHATLFKWGLFNFRPFSYDFLFRTINVHILLHRPMPKDFDEAKERIYTALREGRLFISHDRLGSGRGFKFYFLSEDGSDLMVGEEDTFHKGELIVELPTVGEIRLIRDGTLVETWRGKEAIYPVLQKGVYRVEIYRKTPLFGWRPWIFSNPIYLR
jgi:hypothetical protein